MHVKPRTPSHNARAARRALSRPLNVRLFAVLLFIFAIVLIRQWAYLEALPKASRLSVTSSLAIDWLSECGCTGIEVESVALTTRLLPRFPKLRLNECKDRCADFPADTEKALKALTKKRQYGDAADVIVLHIAYLGICGMPDDLLLRSQGDDRPYLIARAMTEVDSIHPEEAMACGNFDEVWVPSNFVREAFARGGVPLDKIRRVPETIDFAHFDPEGPVAKSAPRLFPASSGVTFAWLSVFKWEERKGWRYLLKAFVREFGSDDTVGLYIKTSNYMGADAAAEAAALLDRLAGSEDEAVRGPAQALLKRRAERVVVDTSQWSAADMPKLFAGADAFVLPTRGEGWGLSPFEALAMGMPVVSTDFGGGRDFLRRGAPNAYLVDVSEMTEIGPDQPGRWASVDMDSLTSQMRAARAVPREEAREAGREARKQLLREFGGVAGVNEAAARLLAIERSRRADAKKRRSAAAGGRKAGAGGDRPPQRAT